MLYIGDTIDLLNHRMIELKTDEDIVLTEDHKKVNLTFEFPEETLNKFCFIKDCHMEKIFISYNKFDGGVVSSKIKYDISILKDRSVEKDVTVPANAVVAYLCYLKKDINETTETTETEEQTE